VTVIKGFRFLHRAILRDRPDNLTIPILGLIEFGVKEGATLALDGRGVKVQGYEKGNFIGPTIFADVTTEMQIYQQEIFSLLLLLVVLGVPTLDDAIELVNRNP
jgi:malonate-semialdehyde dehydrogenase (acetylating)/methylmalonate-semialdehyde dehydrogenase